MALAPEMLMPWPIPGEREDPSLKFAIAAAVLKEHRDELCALLQLWSERQMTFLDSALKARDTLHEEVPPNGASTIQPGEPFTENEMGEDLKTRTVLSDTSDAFGAPAVRLDIGEAPEAYDTKAALSDTSDAFGAPVRLDIGEAPEAYDTKAALSDTSDAVGAPVRLDIGEAPEAYEVMLSEAYSIMMSETTEQEKSPTAAKTRARIGRRIGRDVSELNIASSNPMAMGLMSSQASALSSAWGSWFASPKLELFRHSRSDGNTNRLSESQNLSPRMFSSTMLSRKKLESQRFKQAGLLEVKYGSASEHEAPVHDNLALKGACGLMTRVVSHNAFIFISSLVILGDTMVLAASSDFLMRNPDGDVGAYLYADMVCCIAFVIELMMRLAATGRSFFTERRWLWNVLDFLVVLIAMLDVSISLVWAEGLFRINLTFIKLFRLLKVFVGIHRLGLQRRTGHFRFLLIAIYEQVESLCWFMLVVFAVVYTFALYFSQAVSGHLSQLPSSMREDAREGLGLYWSSVGTAMLSLLMSVTHGRDWNLIAEPLFEIGMDCYLAFLLYIVMSIFIVLNLVASAFVRAAMQATQRAVTIKEHMERKEEYIAALEDVFDKELDLLEFGKYQNGDGEAHLVMADFCSKLNLSRVDVENLFFCLSAGGSREVNIRNFVVACIQLKELPTKMDMLELHVDQLNTLEQAQQMRVDQLEAVERADRNQQQLEERLKVGHDQGTLAEMEGKKLLGISTVPTSVFVEAVIYSCAEPEQHLLTPEDFSTFLDTVTRTLKMALQAKGGTGFVVARHQAFENLKQKGADFQVVDSSDKYPKGYMTERLANLHISEPDFLQALTDFSDHTQEVGDKWIPGHEAEGLPKDGYTLINLSGKRLLGAARLVGMPMPPYKWDRVGTRHLAGLAIACSLRREVAIVIIRSDSGWIHALIPQPYRVKVIRTKAPSMSENA